MKVHRDEIAAIRKGVSRRVKMVLRRQPSRRNPSVTAHKVASNFARTQLFMEATVDVPVIPSRRMSPGNQYVDQRLSNEGAQV